MTATKELNKLVFNIGKRYNTFDPFTWADELNVQIYWKEVADKPLAETLYYGDTPIIMMSNTIRYSTQKYFVLAHELCHVIEQDGLSAYYSSNVRFKNKSENSADEFAMSVVTNLYIEEHGRLPDTYSDLRWNYGLPDMRY
ncbi:ImmA/IrrE family metallo-endopeptidase [Companilactobacillus kedongensis]|uniref:ImmA/IrrE family metallo-endopeptidase n=1 Tax=Companilactobacillus kedongensis TaxID=2486004 RepID=UPI000F78A15F|nr:ImmA/IrrE family metallo-endopeptidase [Companilactobacillus kedongensis]